MIATPVSSKSNAITEIRPGLPTICGWEQEIAAIVNHDDPIFLPTTNLQLDNIQAGFACALHMHQPTIPAGVNGELICNLQHMFEIAD
jgi:hypothetical protein